ncbi:MAG: nucleotidyltransferase family protein [Planctomycetota bacterium]|nr:nucleotidyltransferase family protein [Planctomycetota bacterium]
MTSRDHILAELTRLMPQLRAKFGVVSLSLFGSFARGTARADSDVDVLVDFESTPSLFTLSSLRLFLCDALGRDVDVATPGGLRPVARDAVMQEALRVA